jgi:predicted metal-dependent hydrolase
MKALSDLETQDDEKAYRILNSNNAKFQKQNILKKIKENGFDIANLNLSLFLERRRNKINAMNLAELLNESFEENIPNLLKNVLNNIQKAFQSNKPLGQKFINQEGEIKDYLGHR